MSYNNNIQCRGCQKGVKVYLTTMQESSLSFSPISSEEAGFFKLLELTPELVTLIEEATINHSDTPR